MIKTNSVNLANLLFLPHRSLFRRIKQYYPNVEIQQNGRCLDALLTDEQVIKIVMTTKTNKEHKEKVLSHLGITKNKVERDNELEYFKAKCLVYSTDLIKTTKELMKVRKEFEDYKREYPCKQMELDLV